MSQSSLITQIIVLNSCVNWRVNWRRIILFQDFESSAYKNQKQCALSGKFRNSLISQNGYLYYSIPCLSSMLGGTQKIVINMRRNPSGIIKNIISIIIKENLIIQTKGGEYEHV